jgi:serine/threonine protein kinase/Flp pilus assembly protein TadD
MTPSAAAASVPSPSQSDKGFADLVEELTARLQAGEAVDPEALRRDHPDHADRLEQLLPALRLLVDVSRSRPDGLLALSPADSDPLAGTLGDFRLIREVGRGGMGVVYEAEQISLGRRVALKVLPFAATMDSRQLQRFKNEAHAAAQLHHTNIVPVYAVGCERSVHFYAMQYIEGHSLAEVIAELRGQTGDAATKPQPSPSPQVEATVDAGAGQVISPDSATSAVRQTKPIAALSTVRSAKDATYFRTVAELGIQAAEALDFAHEHGVIHRDVKPANLLVDAESRLWVTDFGLAQVQGDARMTMTGDLVGTLRYMSPEQALAKRVVVDHRTDVYSLGATLYELLTLEPAFTGTDRQELLRQIAFEEPRPPRRVKRTIPAELETIVLKAMEKNPAERYATAKEMADDLQHFLEDKPIRARRPSVVQLLRKWSRRHKAFVAAAGVVVSLAALLAGFNWIWWAQQRAERHGALKANLEEAEEARSRSDWNSARLAIERAQARFMSSDPARLRVRMEEVRTDLDMVTELGRVRMLGIQVKDGKFDEQAAANGYEAAYRNYGIDVGVLSFEETVQRIENSAIKSVLTNSLDSWGSFEVQSNKVRQRILATAKAVDPDPWRNEVRDAIIRKDSSELKRLASSDQALSLPPESLAGLAKYLLVYREPTRAVDLLRRAQRLHPEDFWINENLGLCLNEVKPRQAEESLRFYSAALALRPDSPGAHVNLGGVLEGLARVDEAIAEYKEAIKYKKDYAQAHVALGHLLCDKKHDYDAAITAFQAAIELRPEWADPHHNLGTAFYGKGLWDRAIVEYEEAIRLNNNDPNPHNGLGVALMIKGRPDRAIPHFHEAIRLRKDFPLAHSNLGAALQEIGQQDEAVAEYKEAIRLNLEFPEAHYNLGRVFGDQGRLDEAMAEYREAIRLKNDYSQAHSGLGIVLRRAGRLAEAIAEFREAIRLRKDNTRDRDNLRTTELLVELDARLPKILKGELQPADVGERLALAQMCQEYKGLYLAAFRFYRDAFTEQPQLTEDLQHQHRYNAACTAALAGCGQGKDADQIDDEERVRLRRQALDWLRADLAAWRQLLDKEPDKVRPVVLKTMQHWQQDKDFAGVRGPEALAKLPEAERNDWQKLWAEVDQLRQEATKPAK